MTGLPLLRDRLAGHGYELLRAWPRDQGHLLLHLRRAADPGRHDGATAHAGAAWVAGQWFGDDGRAAAVARSTPAGTDGPTWHLGGAGVVVQPGGADARLDLAGRLAVPGATLLAHRPGRRGVLRVPGPDGEGARYTKVVRPARTAALAVSASWRPVGVRVPDVVEVDGRRGSVTTRDLGGVPLHDLPPGRDDAWTEAGATVAALHASRPPDGVRPHDEAGELAVTVRWVEHARAHAALDPAQALQLLARAHDAARSLRVLADRAAGAGPLHRDLHDKQVLVGTSGAGVLDLDLVAVGDPALDVANLLVHLHLRDLQAEAVGGGGGGRTAGDRADGRARAFLSGYGDARPPGSSGPVRLDPGRVRAWAVLAAVRVAAVYAFRAVLAPGGTQQADVGGAALGLRLVERVDGRVDETGLTGLS